MKWEEKSEENMMVPRSMTTTNSVRKKIKFYNGKIRMEERSSIDVSVLYVAVFYR
jgi:hypothetical protein